MSVGDLLLLLGGAGLLGGIFNALSEQIGGRDGFVLPNIERRADGSRVIRPGFVANLLYGVLAAVVVAILYSPLAAVELSGSGAPIRLSLTLGALVGAVLSGIGGSRLLTAEVNRRLELATKGELAEAIKVLATRVGQGGTSTQPSSESAGLERTP